jgi:hypothetical protein
MDPKHSRIQSAHSVQLVLTPNSAEFWVPADLVHEEQAHGDRKCGQGGECKGEACRHEEFLVRKDLLQLGNDITQPQQRPLKPDNDIPGALDEPHGNNQHLRNTQLVADKVRRSKIGE